MADDDLAPAPKSLVKHRGNPRSFKALWEEAMRKNSRVGRDSMTLRTINTFVEKLPGGIDGVADFYNHTHQAVLDSPSAHVKVGWARVLSEMGQTRDKEEADSLASEVSEEELHMIMIGGMIDEVRTNVEFAWEIVVECLRSLVNDRAKLNDVIEMARSARDEGEVALPSQTLLGPLG